MVLLDNNTDALTVSANGSFTFATGLKSGSSYAVTVATQPTGERCQVANGGPGVVSADVTNVAVACTPILFTIGGTASGLSSGGSVVLLDNGTDALTVSANGSFTFATPLAGGASYTVTVGTQPAGESCQVTNGGPAMVSASVTNVAVTCTAGSVVAQRALAQTGLSIGLAAVVLQSQMEVFALAQSPTSCEAATDGPFSVQTGTTPTLTLPDGTALYPVILYYDANCTRPYITGDVTAVSQAGEDTLAMSETATFSGLNGTNLGTMTLNVKLVGLDEGMEVYGLSVFTPASGLKTPVHLGLYCTIPLNGPCAGAIVQDFPALDLALGTVTAITLTPIKDASDDPTGLTFTASGSTVSGPMGLLTLTNPSPASFVIQGATAYASTTGSGGAAFSLSSSTPTSWRLTDAAHDTQFQISMVNTTTRALSLTIAQVSTGATLATGSVDHSGTGTITYSDGSTAAITSWTLAD